MSTDAVLAETLKSLTLPGLLIGHRLISAGDENALLPEEASSIASGVPAKRRASGAARIVARELLAQFGFRRQPIPKAASGAPVWPDGMTGSFAHDERVAVAAVGRIAEIGSIGIDVEPALPLPADVLSLVVSPAEKATLGDDMLRARLLFAAKEAVYKALYPVDGRFLEYSDIVVDIEAGKAHVNGSRAVSLTFCVSTHLVALARA